MPPSSTHSSLIESPAPTSSKRTRPSKPILLSPIDSSSDSSYDDEPAPPVKRRRATAKASETPAPKSAFDLLTPEKSAKKPPAKRAPTAAAITKAGKGILENHNAGDALTPKQTEDLLAYTRLLEEKLEGKKLSPQEIHKQVDKLRGVIRRGIEKQIKWSDRCKSNKAWFKFEGKCDQPEVMASLLGVELGGRKVKEKTFPLKQFQKRIVDFPIKGSARYSYLYLTGPIDVTWSSGTGKYKFTGTYGAEKSKDDVNHWALLSNSDEE